MASSFPSDIIPFSICFHYLLHGLLVSIRHHPFLYLLPLPPPWPPRFHPTSSLSLSASRAFLPGPANADPSASSASASKLPSPAPRVASPALGNFRPPSLFPPAR